MAEPYHQRGRRGLRVLAAIVAVVLAAVYAVFLIFLRHWAATNPYETVRPWLILVLVVSGAVLLVMLAELFVLGLPLARGLVNECLGRSARAAGCYQNALSVYLRGGYFPFRTGSRIGGMVLFFWKNDALDLTGDESFEFLKNVRDAFNHLQKGTVTGLLLPLSFFRDFNDIFTDIHFEEIEGLGELEEIIRAAKLARLEKRTAKTANSGPGKLDRGMVLYQLGKYEDARTLFDSATEGFEASGYTELVELARLLGALATWEIGDRADCGRRLRGLRPADFDIRLQVITLRALLASVQGKPQKAAATLERIAPRVRDSNVNADALAWLTSARYGTAHARPL